MGPQWWEGVWDHSGGRGCGTTVAGGGVGPQWREGVWDHSGGRGCGTAVVGGGVGPQWREGVWDCHLASSNELQPPPNCYKYCC